MAVRPFFIPSKNKDDLVKKETVEFQWFPGFAKSQKQKLVMSIWAS